MLYRCLSRLAGVVLLVRVVVRVVVELRVEMRVEVGVSAHLVHSLGIEFGGVVCEAGFRFFVRAEESY